MTEESHMGWKLVRGVRRDVINFFKLFAHTDSVRFEDFCKVWKEMSFSLIFSNRTSFIGLLEFSEELLQIVKEYLFSVYEFHTRVAALYMLYGLYFKQPIRGAAKIRFTKTEWEEVYSLVNNCKAAKHYDVAFVFIKLYLNGAYTFSATLRPVGLERGFRKYFEKRNSLFTKGLDMELLYRPLISEKLVNSLIKLESLYCKKKSELLGSKNLVFIDGKFAKTLEEELKEYASALHAQQNIKNRAEKSIEISQCSIDKVRPSCTEDAVQTKTRPDRKKNKNALKNSDFNKDISNKWSKFSKKNLELMAKKKAEHYIQILQMKNAQDESSNKKPRLMGLCELDCSESLEVNGRSKAFKTQLGFFISSA